MKLSLLIASSIVSVASAQTVAESDVQFFTALVSDLKANLGSYIDFMGTAKNIPPAITKYAKPLQTYTDDSYTTLLENSDVNVASLRAFASELPWYSKIEEAAAAGASDDASATEASGSGLITSASSKTSESSKSSAAASSGSSEASSSSKAAGSALYAPVGGAIAVAAIAML
jgi:cobalamin biosynthesis Mg chelatase CobN